MKNGKFVISNELKLCLLLARKETACDNNMNIDDEGIYSIKGCGIDWDEFLFQVIQHKLVPIVHASVIKYKNNINIPQSVVEQIEQLNDAAKFRTVKNLLEVKRIAGLFTSNNIRFFILKGVPLAIGIYGKANLRDASDLDILVHKQDLSKALELITRDDYITYTEEFAKVLSNIDSSKVLHDYHHVDLINEKRKTQIELHWKLGKEYLFISLNQPESVFYFDNLWRNKSELSISSDQKLFVFSLEDQILYLVYHASGHLFMRLKWLADIYEILKSDEKIDWQILMVKAQKAELMNALLLSIKLCSIYFDLEINTLQKKINKLSLMELLEGKKINRISMIINNFIILNSKKLNEKNTSINFFIQKRIFFLLCRLFLCNRKKRRALVFLELRGFVRGLYKMYVDKRQVC